jgi:hypothetical protein
MSCFLFVNDDDRVNKLNIDDLYENKQRRDLKQVAIFNKILNRLQNRIKLTARNKSNETHIWFVVPEYIFGEPIYDKGECVAYLVSKLESDKFHIKYVHPNTLFVSWSHWIPSYVRAEFKKKTGLILDERGNVVDKSQEEEESQDPTKSRTDKNGKPQKEYTPIAKYKPTGNLVYNPEMFEKIEKKMSL